MSNSSKNKYNARDIYLNFAERNNFNNIFSLQQDINDFIEKQKPKLISDLKELFIIVIKSLSYKYFLYSLFFFLHH